MTAIRAARTVPVLLLIAAAGGLGSGIATSYLQGVLPGSWNTIANSGAVWTVVAFGLAATYVRGRTGAVVAGLVALLAEVAGYYAVASPLRGVATAPSERVLWTLAAVVIGPAAGAAAYYWRRGTATERVSAAVGVCGVVAGEGLHAVLRIADGRRSGWVEIAVGGAVALVALVLTTADPRGRVLAIGAGVLAAAAVYLAYGDVWL